MRMQLLKIVVVLLAAGSGDTRPQNGGYPAENDNIHFELRSDVVSAMKRLFSNEASAT